MTNRKGARPPVSKIRQAVDYERQLAKSEVKAHREITTLALKHERKMAQLELKAAVRARDKEIAYERKLTDGQFHTLTLLNSDHRDFHEREHILYENAVDKASAAIQAEMSAMRKDIEDLTIASRNFMSTGRFEREHQALIERVDDKFAVYDEKITAEEKVTVRQAAQSDLSDKISIGNRWLIGIAVTVVIFGATTLLHAFGVL